MSGKIFVILEIIRYNFLYMTSYKIHSIKESQKLSFIIEWESVDAVKQKLTNEWHIVLTIWESDSTLEHYFYFEWKKPSGEYIEWKISSENIFLAYEILVLEYKYILTKLYPEGIDDGEKQKKMFQDILTCFQTNITTEVVEKQDTSKKELLFYRQVIDELVKILKDNSFSDEWLFSELKKLQQNNSVPTVHQWVIEILRQLSVNKYDSLYRWLKKPMKDMWIFVYPQAYLDGLFFIKKIITYIQPLFYRENESEKLAVALSKEKSQSDGSYKAIQDNEHIHIFLQKKYRSSLQNLLIGTWRMYYFYTLLRQNKILNFLLSVWRLQNKILHISLVFFSIFIIYVLFSWGYHVSFFSGTPVMLLIFLIVFSLVFENETV